MIKQIKNLCQALENTKSHEKRNFGCPWAHISVPESCRVKYFCIKASLITPSCPHSPKTPKGPLINLRDQIGSLGHEADDCDIKPREGLATPRMLEICGAASKVPGEKRFGATSSYQQGGWLFLFHFYILGRSIRFYMGEKTKYSFDLRNSLKTTSLENFSSLCTE